jgi:hypothetical protein
MALTQVTSGLISSVSNTAITGLITSSQIANVANSQVTGLGTMSIQNSNNVTITGGNVCTTYVCSTYLCGTTSANAAISCSSTCKVSPYICGTTCVTSPIICGATCLTSPYLNATCGYFSGCLGIGTSSPSQPLTISTNASSSSSPSIYINPTTGTNGSIIGFNNSGSGALYVGRSDSSGNGSGLTLTAYDSFLATTGTTGISFNTNNTQAMYISSGQKVGIGTSSPSQALDVNGSISIAASSNLYFNYASGYSPRISNSGSNDSLSIFTNNTERLRVDVNGNLGLGVTPSAWSNIKAFQLPSGVYLGSYTGSSTPNLYLGTNNYFNGSNFIYSGSYAASKYEQSGGAHSWYNAASGTAGNAITFTQAMTLDSSSRLCVAGCVSSPIVCGSCCVVASVVCSTGGIATPCCVTAAIVCGTTCLISAIVCACTCFVGNGSGLTNLPVAASTLSCICSITATNASSIAFTGLSSSYRYYYLQFDQAFTCDCSGLITAFSNNNGSSYISVTCYFQSSAVCSASSTCNGVIYNNHPSSACVSGIMCIFNAGKPYHLQTMSTVNFGYSNATQLASYASILVGAYCCINAFCMFDCCGTTFSGVFTLYGVS